MAINISTGAETGFIPVFQKVLEMARGGFTLDTSGFSAGDVIPAGTAMTFDEDTRLAKPATIEEDESNAKGLLYEDVVVPDPTSGNADVGIVTRGTAYNKRLPENTDDHADALPLIIFSESF